MSSLAHRIGVCIIDENVNLLLEVLSKEVHDLKNNLNEFLSKLVCDESEERCMMSCCDTCKNNFKQHIIKKIIDKKKVVKWHQWINDNGQAIKQFLFGKNESQLYFYSVRIKTLLFL
jgi:hypothetical protein